MNVAGYEHDEPMIYGKLAIDAHDAKIRAEALRYAEDIVCALWPDQAAIRVAILAGEARLPLPPEVLMDARQDTMHVDTGARRSVKAIRAALGNED